jgi:hypothetical protein
MTTGVIDAKQGREVMTLDFPNSFVQAKTALDGDKIIMKIRGKQIDKLQEICPGMYKDYLINEGKHKILYVRMLRALCGMLVSLILYYKKFRKDMEAIGFEVNPYDTLCVANRTVNGKQQTLAWHVDDLKSSHVNPMMIHSSYQSHSFCRRSKYFCFQDARLPLLCPPAFCHLS